MQILYTTQKSKKAAKKKPGWQKQEAEYKAWQDSISSMKLFDNRRRASKPLKHTLESPVVSKPVIRESAKIPSLNSFGGTATKAVPRPEIQYKDNQELLQRELAARERKFNVAPAYNKGGDQFVSEEELANLLRGNKRRS